MSLPSLRDTADLTGWAKALVAELARALEILNRAHIGGQVLSLPVYAPGNLPGPTAPGLVVAVRDGTSGVLMLISSDHNTWRRTDDYTVYS
jgi:hypothetical protein